MKWQCRNKNCGCINWICTAVAVQRHARCTAHAYLELQQSECKMLLAAHTWTRYKLKPRVLLDGGNGRREKMCSKTKCMIWSRHALFINGDDDWWVKLWMREQVCAPRRMSVRADRSVWREVIGFYFRCLYSVIIVFFFFLSYKHSIDANYIYLLLFRRSHKVNNTASGNDSHTWSHTCSSFVFRVVSISCERANDNMEKEFGKLTCEISHAFVPRSHHRTQIRKTKTIEQREKIIMIWCINRLVAMTDAPSRTVIAYMNDSSLVFYENCISTINVRSGSNASNEGTEHEAKLIDMRWRIFIELRSGKFSGHVDRIAECHERN